ncbi:GntR family transcriptional regulator, partial [Terriglobus sp. TAA 43]|uniref:GntR family transcriptional regulator n=1 Tax=Terriglobus sp. TAA 43 TaxID=278961 RepID=UPI000646CAD6
MPRIVSSFELSIKNRPPHQVLTKWLYEELRNAILEGRLEAGSRLPASRDFARQYGLSRGTVVSVFERLLDEGYISSRVGVGTWINPVAATVPPHKPLTSTPPAYVGNVISSYVRPKPYVELVWKAECLPFRASDPAVAEFPAEIWGRIAAKRSRNFRSWLDTPADGSGYPPLRDAIAHYLRTSRGVR